MRIDVKLKKLSDQFDPRKFMGKVRERVRAETYNATAKFARTALANIPVLTGQARGTFLPISRFLKAKGAKFDVVIDVTGAKPLENKSFMTGGEGDKQNIFQFNENQYGIYFDIDKQLLYYIINDSVDMNYSTPIKTPWHSFEKGKKAADEYLASIVKTILPKVLNG